ncbi:DMT family transporter [Natronomonas sp. EA1]|uniref:DMT family transporter n=1 Tax=Natronomonas sp. EA1 TaxID=3421655 RepID=UPI003EBE7F89
MTRYRTLLLFLTLSAVWGTAFPATKAALDYLPPVTLAAVRFDIASLALFAYAVGTGAALRPRTREDFAVILSGGSLTVGAHHAFLFAGQQFVTSAVAAVLLGVIPVVTPALTRLTPGGKRLSPIGLVGVLVGFGGVVVIADPDPARLATEGLLGVALVLASALVFVVGAIYISEQSPDLGLVSRQAWTMLVGALLLHVAALPLPDEPSVPGALPLRGLAALGYLAVVAGAFGFGLYFFLLERVGPIEVSFLEYTIPLFAAATGWFLLDEPVAPNTVAGFLCILVGFLLVKRVAIRAELRRAVDRHG